MDLLKPSYATGYAKNASQSAHPNLWDGLVGAWMPSLGVTGNTLRDVSGNGNHGTLTNMDAATDWEARHGSQSLQTNTNKYVDCVGKVSDMQFDHDFTVVARIANISLAIVDAGVVAKATVSDGYKGWIILATSSGVYAYWNGAFRSGVAAISFGSKKYTNIVMRFRFPYVNLFIDGVLSSTGYTTTYPAASSSPLHIGEYDFTANRSIKADFSSVYIYERAINNAEIKQLYVDSLAPFRKKQRVSVAVPAGITFKPYWAKQSTQISGLLK